MKLKNRLTNWVLSGILNAPLEEEILQEVNGQFYYQGKPLPQVDVQEVSSGAEAIRQTLAYRLVMKELRRLSQERIAVKSGNWDDVVFGKACLYISDLIDRKLTKLSRIKRS